MLSTNSAYLPLQFAVMIWTITLKFTVWRTGNVNLSSCHATTEVKALTFRLRSLKSVNTYPPTLGVGLIPTQVNLISTGLRTVWDQY